MARGIARVLVGVLVVGVLAGCTGGGEEPSGLSTVTAEPTAAASPTPTPASIVGVVVDLSDPWLGIVFDDVPALSGDEADVYNWIATYRQEYWRTLKTNKASPAFSVFTSTDVKARMEEIATNNAADRFLVDGVFRVSISDVSVDGDAASGTSCDDYGEATFRDVNGSYTPEEAGVAEPVLLEVTLARNSDDRTALTRAADRVAVAGGGRRLPGGGLFCPVSR